MRKSEKIQCVGAVCFRIFYTDFSHNPLTVCVERYIIYVIEDTKKRIQEIEVAFFKSTFYEVSGTDEEKGKERTPKAGTA